MPIRKRGEHWHVDIVTPDGSRIRHSTGTTDKARAQEYHDKLKHDLWQEARLGVKPAFLWEDAAVRYLKEAAHKKSYEDDLRGIAFWTEHFRGRELKSLTRAEIAEHIERRYEKPASRNRAVAVIRALLRKAEREWEWIDRAPAVRTYKEPDGRVRWETPAAIARLLVELPPWLRQMARFALATGLRQANVYKLRWDRINMQMRTVDIPSAEFKSGRPFTCHLNPDAVEVLREQLGKHHTYVFVDAQGEPIDDWRTWFDLEWKRCCKGVGIADFRWHDLRHTWASWHVQNGTDIYELKELGGWETIEMPMRYAHLGAAKLRAAANRVTNLSQLSTVENEKASVQAG